MAERRGPYVLAVDQGTSSTKTVLVDHGGRIVADASRPLGISYPRPGWVEQDPTAVLDSVLASVEACLDGVATDAVAGLGLSTQRESALLWRRDTGAPVGPMLGWQDRRSASVCDAVRAAGHEDEVRRISGLPLDPMFSAAKARWLLDAVDPDRSMSGAGLLALGTVDSWLMFCLTGQHVAERGNASRTQLLDVHAGDWSPRLLTVFGVPPEVLGRLTSSTGDLGTVVRPGLAVSGTTVRAVLGDSHAALRAHGAQAVGGAKVTYGTGSSVMRAIDGSVATRRAVGTTIAWDDGADGGIRLALEGNIRSSGATVGWLAGLLGTSPAAVAEAAAGSDAGGVHLVPAFGGLAAPWWDDTAVGTLSGLTFGTTAAHLARAAIESVAHQVDDVVSATEDVAGPVTHLLADGGASANDDLMQTQADLCGRPVRRARERDLSALGAAHLAGAAAGLWPRTGPPDAVTYDGFVPRSTPDEVRERRTAWRTAVARSLGAVAPATPRHD